MKEVVKIISVLIGVLLLFGLVSCSTGVTPLEETIESTITSPGTTASVVTTKVETTTKIETTTVQISEKNPFEDKMTISWLWNTWQYNEGRWDELELEDLFNVELEPWNIRVSTADLEPITMMLAAGDIPDIGYIYRDPVYLYNEKFIRTVPIQTFKTVLPEYYNEMQKTPIGWTYNACPDKPNEMLMMNFLSGRHNFLENHFMIRLDWLSNIGMEPDNLYPVELMAEMYKDRLYFTNHKYTLDDINEMLRAFTEDDPDGNGEDDTFGAIRPDITWKQTFEPMFGYSSLNNWLFKDQDSSSKDYVPFYAFTGYRDFYKWVSENYQKGYVRGLPGVSSWDKESYQTWGEGLCGFIVSHSQYVTYVSATGEYITPPGNTIMKNSDASYVTILPPVGPKGSGYTFNNIEPFVAGATGGLIFGCDVSDDKLERILRIINYTSFGDNCFRYQYGIENVHYKWAGEPLKSPMLKTPTDKIPVKYGGTSSLGIFGITNFQNNIIATYSYNEYHIRLYDFLNNYTDGLSKLKLLPDKLISRIYMGDKIDDYNKHYNTVKDSMNTIINDFRNRMLKGEIADFNSEWVQYIDTLYAAGLEDLVEYYNDESFKLFPK